MNLTYLRQSSINTYHDCQFKYFMESILEIPAQAGKKALLGTIVHHVLELIAWHSKNGRKADKYCNPKYLLDICWARYKVEEAHRFTFEPADYTFCAKSIDKVLESPFNPLKLKIVDIERQFQIPIKRKGFDFEFHDIVKQSIRKGWYEIRGTVDLVTEVDKDTLEIVDWKTGKRTDWITGDLKDYEYLSTKDIQLRLYDIATHFLYPQYKNRLLTIFFINDGGPFTVTFDDKQREETFEILRKEFNIIRTNPVPTRLKEEKPLDAKWKCTKVCHFGKTNAPNGVSWCDNIYSYMMNNTVDDTITKVHEIRKNTAVKQLDGKTSNRRNNYDPNI